jgi:hypothetical protein
MEVHRKPTATDVTINNTSCHPKEQKLASYATWIHRLLMLLLDERNKRKGLNAITNIGLNNENKKDDDLCLYNRLKHQQNNLGNNTKTE